MNTPPGKGLDLVRSFYSLLPQRHRWVEAQAGAAEFIIDETFGVPGVGSVVAGAAVRQRYSTAGCPYPGSQLRIVDRCVVSLQQQALR